MLQGELWLRDVMRYYGGFPLHQGAVPSSWQRS